MKWPKPTNCLAARPSPYCIKRESHMSDVSIALDQDQIRRCEKLIRPYVRRTPIIEIDGADAGVTSGRLSLKLQLLQHGGSFKARGAFANLLLREVPEAGVVAASGGNHGVAVALAAKRLGVPAKIFVPRVSSPAKIERIRAAGADLSIVGERYAEALEASENWASASGALRVHAFDQVETLLGQGTIALELSEQLPELETLLVGVGGGGLMVGVAAYYAGRIRIVAVEPEGAPTLTRALEAGRPVDAPTGSIAADSLAPARVGEIVLPLVQRYVDRVVLVTDDEIRKAQQALWRVLRVVAEPGGAAAFAAILSGRYVGTSSERVGVIVSGGNTVAVDFGR